MDPDKLQEISERDQLWASLRGLRPEIADLAATDGELTDRQRQLVILLARIVMAEMQYRDQDATEL